MTIPIRPAHGGFRWNAKAGQYIAPNGRFVTRNAVRNALDHAIGRAGQRAQAFAQQLRNGQISLLTWQREMRQVIKEVQLYSAAAAQGGWAQMDPATFGRVGARVAEEYRFLDAFAAQIGGKLVPLDGRFLRRVTLYTESGRKMFHEITSDRMVEQGQTEERNVLHPAEHCEECVQQSDAGWVTIGTLVPIGRRQCLTACKCTMRYRRVA